MLTSLGRFLVRRRVAVLVAAVLAMVVAGALGGGVAKHLSGGGFEDTGAESSRAKRVLEASFGTQNPNLVLLVTAKDGSVDGAAAAAAGAALTRELGAEAGITRAASYWTLGSPPPLRSNDGRRVLEPASGQVRGHPTAHRAGDHHGQQGAHQHHHPTTDHEPAERSEHL